MRSARTDAYHNLATLLDGGVPASRAFGAAVEGHRGPFADALRQVGDGIRDGVGLEETLATLSPPLPILDRTMMEVGESTGRLPEAFRLLSSWYALEDRVKRQIMAGLALPFAVIHIAALIFPLPRLLTGGGVDAYLFGVVQVLGAWYLAAIVAWFAWRAEGVRRIVDPLLLGVPFLGRAILRLELGRYCRAFAALHGAGLPASRCARLAAEVCSNRRISETLAGGADAAERGEPISSGFGAGLPPEFLALWTTGEETGALDDTTTRLAHRMEEDAEFVIGELARWAPRIVYAVVMVQMIIMIFSTFSSIYR